MIFWCLLIFFSKSTFLKNYFMNIAWLSNRLDPDQARHFVGPDLDPICLCKGYEQTTLARHRVKSNKQHYWYLFDLKDAIIVKKKKNRQNSLLAWEGLKSFFRSHIRNPKISITFHQFIITIMSSAGNICKQFGPRSGSDLVLNCLTLQ